MRVFCVSHFGNETTTCKVKQARSLGTFLDSPPPTAQLWYCITPDWIPSVAPNCQQWTLFLVYSSPFVTVRVRCSMISLSPSSLLLPGCCRSQYLVWHLKLSTPWSLLAILTSVSKTLVDSTKLSCSQHLINDSGYFWLHLITPCLPEHPSFQFLPCQTLDIPLGTIPLSSLHEDCLGFHS